MRKKILATLVCAAMGLAMCACSRTTPTDSEIPTPQGVTPDATVTTSPTETGGDTAEEVPITNYEDCVAVTKLAKDYIGIPVEKVTDAELEAYILEVLEENMLLEEKDGTVENGDVANIDFTGYLDNEPFEGGSDVGFDLEIGSGQFIEGFEEGLVGAKKGETRSLELTFPEDYRNNPDMAGKAVVFEVKVNAICRYVLPELTDEFIKELTSEEYTTVQAFKEYSLGLLTEEKEYLAVMDYLVENTEFAELNEAYIQASLDSMKSYYELYAQMFGVDLETFFLYSGIPDSKAFWTEMESQMRRAEQERIVLYCVAKAEGITLT
ncbi:MAG: trigger factor, partial [Lachnospiraceae bacterium]